MQEAHVALSTTQREKEDLLSEISAKTTEIESLNEQHLKNVSLWEVKSRESQELLEKMTRELDQKQNQLANEMKQEVERRNGLIEEKQNDINRYKETISRLEGENSAIRDQLEDLRGREGKALDGQCHFL